MELEDTEILTQKSVTGSSDTALERIVNQTITDTSILPPFISKLDVNTGLSGISAIPFVDTVGADDANFTVGSTKVSKSKDFTTAEVTTETIEDAVTEVGIDSTIQNILDIQTVKKIEASILEALNSDTRIRYSMNPSWAGIHEGILELGSDIYSIVGTIYVAVSLPVYLNLIENEDENLVKLLGSKLKLVIMEGFTNSQLLIVHEYGVAGGIGVKNIEKERKPGLDRVDYTAPFTHSFGWDPRFIRFSGALYSRYFRRNEGTTDYVTIPAVTLTGDFEFSCLLYRTNPNVAGEFAFASYDTSIGSYGLNLYTSGDWGSGNGSVTLFSFGNLTIGGLSVNTFYDIRAVFTKQDNTLKLYLEGVLVSQGVCTPPNGLGSADVSTIYRAAQGGFHFEGILANLKIWDNGTLIRDYPLNDNSNILANRATSLGQELYSFNGLSGWGATRNASTLSVNGENVRVTADSTDTHGGRWQLGGLVIGSTLLVNIELIRGTSVGQIRIRADSGEALAGGELVSYSNPNDGSITAVIKVTATTMYFGTVSTGHAAGQYHDINIISIRQADGYGTIINGNASDWGLFDKQANGDWLGQELIVNGGFDSWSDPTVPDGWSKVSSHNADNFVEQLPPSTLHMVSDGAYVGIEQLGILTLGANYRVSYSNSIQNDPSMATFTGLTNIIPTGSGYFETIASNTKFEIKRTPYTDSVDASLDRVSVREVLKSA